METIRKLVAVLLVSGGVLISSCCCVHGNLFGATYSFSNLRAGLDVPVFDFDGTRLAGTNYLAMLYGGPTVDSIAPAWDEVFVHEIAPVPLTYMPLGQPGYFRYEGAFGASVVIPTVPCGGTSWLQVRVWDARLGASYEDVASLDIGGYGESNLFQKHGGSNCGLPTPAERLLGLESFALREVIPEPGSILLLLLGVPAHLFFRRRRSK